MGSDFTPAQRNHGSATTIVARCWVIGLLVPALCAIVWELWLNATNPADPNNGIVLSVTVMYGFGFALGTAARLILSAPLVLAAGAVILVTGMPFGAGAVSLGIYALIPSMTGMGIIIVSALTGGSRGLLRR